MGYAKSAKWIAFLASAYAVSGFAVNPLAAVRVEDGARRVCSTFRVLQIVALPRMAASARRAEFA
jgi:hypothetical protein